MSDWLKDGVLPNFKSKLDRFYLVAQLVCGKLVYYTHILATELYVIVCFLLSLGVIPYAMGLWGEENLHCLSNRYTNWAGSYTHLPSTGEEKWKLPYYPLEHDIIRKLILLEMWTYSNDISYGSLANNHELKEFKVELISTRKVRASVESDDSIIAEDEEDEGDKSEFSNKTLQIHRSKEFMNFLHQGMIHKPQHL